MHLITCSLYPMRIQYSRSQMLKKKFPLSFHLWIKRLLHLVILIYSCWGFYLALSACAIYIFWWLYVCSLHIWVGRSFNYLPCTYMHIKLFKALVYRSSGIQNTTKRNLMLIFWILLTSQKKCSSYLLTFFPRFSCWCKFRCLFACLLMSIAFAFMLLFFFSFFFFSVRCLLTANKFVSTTHIE